jgi:hypothetical protein
MQMGVRSLHDEQADVYEDGSSEGDWVFGEVELGPPALVLSTTALILPKKSAFLLPNVCFCRYHNVAVGSKHGYAWHVFTTCITTFVEGQRGAADSPLS